MFRNVMLGYFYFILVCFAVLIYCVEQTSSEVRDLEKPQNSDVLLYVLFCAGHTKYRHRDVTIIRKKVKFEIDSTNYVRDPT